MYKLALLFSMLFAFNANASSNKFSDVCSECKTENLEECTLRNTLFSSSENLQASNLDISTIEIVEIEEDVELNFDTKQYLPKGFNALYSEDVLDHSIANMVLLEIEQELGYKLTKKIYCSL